MTLISDKGKRYDNEGGKTDARKKDRDVRGRRLLLQVEMVINKK